MDQAPATEPPRHGKGKSDGRGTYVKYLQASYPINHPRARVAGRGGGDAASETPPPEPKQPPPQPPGEPSGWTDREQREAADGHRDWRWTPRWGWTDRDTRERWRHGEWDDGWGSQWDDRRWQ